MACPGLYHLFKLHGSDSSFGKEVCYQCHTLVKAKDYIHVAPPEVNGMQG
jgi:hypothetical protein